MLQEIYEALNRFKICPKCSSKEGFWLGIKRDHPYVQCKGCGANFDLFEVYAMSEKDKVPQRLKFFRK